MRESSRAVIEDRLPKQKDRVGLENPGVSFLSVLLRLLHCYDSVVKETIVTVALW